jgi:hypothetical protein
VASVRLSSVRSVVVVSMVERSVVVVIVVVSVDWCGVQVTSVVVERVCNGLRVMEVCVCVCVCACAWGHL